jgi:hypothetical protein
MTELRHLSYRGISFCILVSKKLATCKPQPRFDTIHQLLIIVEPLWSYPVLQVCKQMVIACREIRALRRVVKQLPVEICQQFLSGGSCITDVHRHGGALHSMMAFHNFCSEWPYAVYLVFCNTLLTLLWSLVAWISQSALLSCPTEQLPSSFWQTFV